MDRPSILLDIVPPLVDRLFAPEDQRRLDALGDVTRGPRTAGVAVGDYDVVVTGWGTAPLPEDRGPSDRLRLVAHSAGTVRPFVAKSLLGDGVRVTHAAAAMSQSVAEFALLHTMDLLRRMPEVRATTAERDWLRGNAVVGRTVAGTTVGVVGASRIGRLYIAALRALGARVLLFDPFVQPAEAERLGVEQVTLDELFSRSAVVANHAPVTDATRGMLSAELFARLADGAIFVNTARSAIVDGAALERELVDGRISAALDVFDEEPLPAESPLWSLPNVVVTPHIGAMTVEALLGQGRIAVDEVERFLTVGRLDYEISFDDYDRLA